MVIVKGDTRVVDIYLGEFMRLFSHFYFRHIFNQKTIVDGEEGDKSAFLVPDDSWCAPYYEVNHLKWKERLLFRGRKNSGYGITFFDIDETIFHTKAMIWVMKNGELIKKLTNTAFNDYVLEQGEHFDFREFKDAGLFAETSVPIKPIVAKIVAMMKNAMRTGSKLALLTARQTFEDMGTFKKAFAKHGILIDKMDINFAGDIINEAGSIAEAKKRIVLKYLAHGEYKRVRLLDDNLTNLKEFMSIAREIEGVSFHAFYIDEKGRSKTFHE